MNNVFLVKRHGCIQIIKKSDIYYVKADGSSTIIFFENGQSVRISKNLKNFLAEMKKSEKLIRVHRSFLVREKAIVSFEKNEVHSSRWSVRLSNGVLVAASRSYLKASKHVESS